jgi:hypothetical protein
MDDPGHYVGIVLELEMVLMLVLKDPIIAGLPVPPGG